MGSRLYVQLSNFRITHSDHTPAPLVHILVRSSRAHATPLESPAGVRHDDDDDSVLFPSWRARWDEGTPDFQSVLHLSLRAVDTRSKWKRRRHSAFSNPFVRNSAAKRGPPILGKTSLNLLSMACGTVRRSVRIFTASRDGSFWDISFDGVVEERADIRVQLRDIAVCCPFPLRSAYLVVAIEGPNRLCVVARERHVHSAEPEWDDVPTLVLPKWSLSKLSRAVLAIRVHEAQDDNRCVGVLKLKMHDVWGSVLQSGYSTPFQGELQPRNNSGSAQSDVETVTLGSIRGFAELENVPRTGQMAEGVTTQAGMTGGRPIYCGASLPSDDIIRGEVRDAEDLPRGWVQLYDTFGYRFFYNASTQQNSWVRPTTENDDPDHDVQLAELGFERTQNNFYRSISNGAETWVHPAATCIPAVTYASTNEDTQSEYSSFRPGMSTAASTPVMPRSVPNHRVVSSQSYTSFQLPGAPCAPSTEAPSITSPDLISSAPASTSNPSTDAGISAAQPANTSSAHRSFNVKYGSDEEIPLRPWVISEEKEDCRTETKWIRLRNRGDNQLIPGPATEGHSLTAMHGGRTLLKFGGKGPEGKSNDVIAYDSDSMNWIRIHPLGVPPTPRFGHGAVSVGSDRSRLLVFGGSSRIGRLNDLHILHEENQAWSPVNASGEAPAVRSRLGMTATSAGDMALVFGGRSIYRFLGGTYYDSKHVHAFLADRSQWITMAPRGSGPRPAPRSGCVVEFINDRQMFVHGGYDDGDKYYADSFLFDLASCSWHRTPYPNEPTEPSARESHCSTVVNGSVLIYGGEQDKGGYSTELHLFDPSRLRWVTPPSVSGYSPAGLSGAAMATVNDTSVLLAGGDNGYMVSREAFALDIARFPMADINELKDQARGRNLADALCVVCLDAKVDTMFLWCGHTVCCKNCSKRVSSTCPICRRPVGSVTDMYDILQDVAV